MEEITKILIAALAVYGFYSILWQIRVFIRRFSASQKIDKHVKKEYNKISETSPERRSDP